jgi:hypothetical protein
VSPTPTLRAVAESGRRAESSQDGASPRLGQGVAPPRRTRPLSGGPRASSERFIGGNAPRRDVRRRLLLPLVVARVEPSGAARSRRGSQGEPGVAPSRWIAPGRLIGPSFSAGAAFGCRSHPFARGAQAAWSPSVRRATVVSPPRGGRCPCTRRRIVADQPSAGHASANCRLAPPGRRRAQRGGRSPRSERTMRATSGDPAHTKAIERLGEPFVPE